MVTAGSPMHAFLHIRSDAERKPGGDYSLIKTFAGLLRERGHVVSVAIGDVPLPDDCTVALTINLDSPFEPWCVLERARQRRIPVCLYTLHHPSAGFSAYLAHGTTGARRCAAFLARRDPQRYLGLLASARTLVQGGNRRRFWRAGQVRTLQASLLERCSSIIASSQLECAQILTDFPIAGPRARLTVVPHAFVRQPAAAISRDAKLAVCPGRIESRKNQIAVLEAARHFPDRHFTFVGALNPSEWAYCQRFLAMIAATPNATHVGGLGLDAFRSLLASAGVAASASWFEVVSLAELEALSQGCQLVATCHSYLPEFAAGRMEAFNPSSSAELVTALKRAFSAADTPEPPLPPDFLIGVDPQHVGDVLEASLQAAIIRGVP